MTDNNSFYIAKEPKHKNDILIAREIKDNVSILNKKLTYGKNVYIDGNTYRINGTIEPTPGYKFVYLLPVKPNENNAIFSFVSGCSGSGKSSSVNHLIRELRNSDKYKKTDKIALISNSKQLDPAYISFPYKKLDIHNPDFMNLTYESFKDCIIILDDVTSVQNPYLQKFILNLAESLMENSRKNNVATIYVSHQSSDYNKTRKIINESSTYILFPLLNPSQTEKFLDSYMGLSSKQIDDIFELDGRSILVHKQFPQYYIASNKIGTFTRNSK